MEDFEEEGPFRYRSGVRAIAVVDAVLSISLLAYLGIMIFFLKSKDTDIPTMLSEELHWNITVGLWITFLLLHVLQLVLSFVLISGSNNSDACTSRSKCQLWLWYANFLCVALTLEIVLLVFNFAKHGMRVYPMAIWGVKVIFRLIARQLVIHYIRDLDKVGPNTVESQFYAGLPRMYQYSADDLGGSNKGAPDGSGGKKKDMNY